jgi:hypothetical protein
VVLVGSSRVAAVPVVQLIRDAITDSVQV